jgi:hypothetical protein
MDPILVLDANIADPVAAVPAPVVGVPVSSAFGMPGCHHRTSLLALAFSSVALSVEANRMPTGRNSFFA